jgi:hypothetical protein
MNLYSFVINNPLNWTDPYGLGKFGERPLDSTPWLKPDGKGDNGGFGDKGNIRPYHEHYWADDDWNRGYGQNGTFQEPKKRREDYKFYEPKYDDDLMKEAFDNIKDRPENQGNKYGLCSISPNGQNNCQDFSDLWRKEYERLKKEKEKNKCGGSKE